MGRKSRPAYSNTGPVKLTVRRPPARRLLARVPVAGLTPQTTYYYRLLASNSNGPHAGALGTFTTPPAVQGLQTSPASKPTGSTVTLNGSFESTGLETHYLFEYGTSESYGSSTPLTDGGSASGTTPVGEPLTGLQPNQEYHYRIVAENTLGRTEGADMSFTTAALAPLIPGNPSASSVAAQSADLSAALNPEHTTTHYRFEYGACPKLAGCTTVQSTPTETSAVYGTVGTSAEVVGLAPTTTYAYRLVAINEFGESTVGAEGTFTTTPASTPGVSTGASTVLGATSAIVFGTVEPHGVPTSYTIEAGIYKGASTQYGIVASGSAGYGDAPVPVSALLTGLQPGLTYAYQVTISSSGYILNETHTLVGGTAQFTTPGLAAALELPSVLTQLPIPSIKFPEALKPPPPKHKKKTTRKKHASRKTGKSKKARRSTAHHRG
jgi:phosphodiesterase/alkaline phosphatase D-like protein